MSVKNERKSHHEINQDYFFLYVLCPNRKVGSLKFLPSFLVWMNGVWHNGRVDIYSILYSTYYIVHVTLLALVQTSSHDPLSYLTRFFSCAYSDLFVYGWLPDFYIYSNRTCSTQGAERIDPRNSICVLITFASRRQSNSVATSIRFCVQVRSSLKPLLLWVWKFSWITWLNNIGGFKYCSVVGNQRTDGSHHLQCRLCRV
jgi:hypothetical protein